MDLLFWRRNKKKENERELRMLQEQSNKKLKSFIVKAVGLISRNTFYRDDFESPIYNLEEIKIASEKDSYIRESLLRHNSLVYKAGYTIKGEDNVVEYLKKRFRIMSYSTSTPVDILMQEISSDMIKYSNAFLVKARIEPKNIPSGLNLKPIYGQKVIGGYFRIDPCTVRIKRDQFGVIKEYQQMVNGEKKEFKPEDVIHLYMHREAGEAFGTPRIISALEDVKLLRKIEGIIVSLIYRFAIPVYQWKIGVPESGFQATDAEIEDAKHEIENMSLDGVMVTNERTDIKAIGVDKAALDASEYLKYFEKRVFTALNVSEAQMGRGGSKQDADSMEAQMHDTVKHVQKTLSIFIENFILSELLLEGGFDPIFNEDHIAQYVFNEINLDTKVKIENHEMLKFQSNVITHEEMRKNTGLKEKCDEDRLYSNMITTDSIIKQIKAKAQYDTKKGNGKDVSQDPNDEVDTKNRPQNQHGQYSAKIKEIQESELKNKIKNDTKEENKKRYKDIFTAYEIIKDGVIENKDKKLDMVFATGKLLLVDEFTKSLNQSAEYGIKHAATELKEHVDVLTLPIPNISEIKRDMENNIDRLLKSINKHITDSNKGKGEIQSIFDSLEYRIRYIIEYQFRKAYWHSYLSTGQVNNIKKAKIDFDGSEDEKDHDEDIDINRYKIKDIPAFHPFCDCTISFVIDKER